MPRYTVRWSLDPSPYAKNDKIETSEFFVGDDPDPIEDWRLSCRRFYRGEWITFEICVHNCRESELDKDPSVNMDRFYWGDLEILRAVRTSDWKHPMWGEPRLAQLSRLAIQIERSTAMIMGRQPRRFMGLAGG